MLRALYADLTQIGQYTSDDVVYHLAHRDLGLDLPGKLYGKQAVIDCELALHRATGGTLTACIDAVTANDHFAAVTGTFHAEFAARPLAFPFCGVWRFRDGQIVEHWQNAYDPAALHQLLGDALVSPGQ
ncbi:nuclear transport factor 2 family protein [Streptomyces lavendulae]